MHEIRTWSPGLNVETAAPNLLDYADALVSQDAARFTRWHVTFQDVQVGTANRRARDSDDCVRGRHELRHRPFVERFAAGSVIHECLHRQSPFVWGNGAST